MSDWILTLTVFTPLIGAVLLLVGGGQHHRRTRYIALLASAATLALAIVALVMFHSAAAKTSAGSFQLRVWIPWFQSGESSNVLDVSYHMAVDGVSIWLLVLTAFLTPLAIWGSFSSIGERVRGYYALMLVLETGMLGVFCAMDLLLFYVFFEFTLIPLYFIIGIWGGPDRQRAANKFFIFTLAGSVFTFAAVLFLAYFGYHNGPQRVFSFNIQRLAELGQYGYIPATTQLYVFVALAAGFAIKVPFFPLHTWLPLAHTEAPTAGSVILAGVLLKLGTYGFFRLSVPILPQASLHFAPVMATLAVVGIIYGALCAWVQRDVKKLVAYSSVSHLGFCMLGLFSLKMAGVTGSVLYMVNHGLSTGALFLVVGMIYERYHTRDIDNIGGLAKPMPWMAFFLVFFTLASIGLPGLNGFVGEFLVLLGTATSATTTDGLAAGPLGYAYVVPAALGIILGAVYMLWMCQRVLFGPRREPPHTPDVSKVSSVDLTSRERLILAPIALACVFLGVYPKPVINSLEPAIAANVFFQPETVAAHDAAGDSGVKPDAPVLGARVAHRGDGS